MESPLCPPCEHCPRPRVSPLALSGGPERPARFGPQCSVATSTRSRCARACLSTGGGSRLAGSLHHVPPPAPSLLLGGALTVTALKDYVEGGGLGMGALPLGSGEMAEAIL
ncbi:hypothetical protein AAFF_G00229680 [Aldrovandia affinis]|uniref:Uncharacterized protein n=1 Tax=Aldrovandia affinis TaxID=143900 RepID=A0AAD7SWR9_9TELE|nr:hypothetical protein AAFF_G00229680 [Aldrovandia affinis]